MSCMCLSEIINLFRSELACPPLINFGSTLWHGSNWYVFSFEVMHIQEVQDWDRPAYIYIGKIGRTHYNFMSQFAASIPPFIPRQLMTLHWVQSSLQDLIPTDIFFLEFMSFSSFYKITLYSSRSFSFLFSSCLYGLGFFPEVACGLITTHMDVTKRKSWATSVRPYHEYVDLFIGGTECIID